MIFDDRHRVAVMHIPKCGGSTVAAQLGDLDSSGGLTDHPTLGRIYRDHLPLAFLESAYPAWFAKVASYESFALVRDPHDRFASAVFHRIEYVLGVTRIQITRRQVFDEAHRVMKWLEGRDQFCDAEYAHFTRQVDYVYLKGRQIVEHVYPLENMEEFGLHLHRLTGIAFDHRVRANVNYASTNGWLFSILYRLRPIYSRLTTWGMREQVLLLLQKLKLHSPRSLYDEFRRDPQISGFVERYYAEDFSLRERARANVAPVLSGSAAARSDPAAAVGS